MHVSLELPMYTYTGAIRDVSTYGRPARQAGYIREGPDEWEGSGGPCHGRPATTTEHAFVSGHLSRLSLGPGQKVALSQVQRLAGPGGAWAFCPGWCYQPKQKAPIRDSSKVSYSILSHMYYLGELTRKSCVSQKVLGSNPARCKKILASGPFCLGSATPGSKTGTKASLKPG